MAYDDIYIAEEIKDTVAPEEHTNLSAQLQRMEDELAKLRSQMNEQSALLDSKFQEADVLVEATSSSWASADVELTKYSEVILAGYLDPQGLCVGSTVLPASVFKTLDTSQRDMQLIARDDSKTFVAFAYYSNGKCYARIYQNLSRAILYGMK